MVATVNQHNEPWNKVRKASECFCGDVTGDLAAVVLNLNFPLGGTDT